MDLIAPTIGAPQCMPNLIPEEWESDLTGAILAAVDRRETHEEG